MKRKMIKNGMVLSGSMVTKYGRERECEYFNNAERTIFSKTKEFMGNDNVMVETECITGI